jgi:hypothetical protein
VSACGYVAVVRAESISSCHPADDLQRIADFDARCLAGPAPLTDRDRAALRAHYDATLRRYHYQHALDIKKQRGIRPALKFLLQVPASIPHVVSETARSHLKAWLPGNRGCEANKTAPEINLLIGTPDVRLSCTMAVETKTDGSPTRQPGTTLQ